MRRGQQAAGPAVHVQRALAGVGLLTEAQRPEHVDEEGIPMPRATLPCWPPETQGKLRGREVLGWIDAYLC